MNPKKNLATLFVNRFHLLLLSSTMSDVGDWLTLIASMILTYNKTSSALGVSAILIVRALPVFLLSFHAGAIVDRFDRKKIMIISNLLRGAFVLILVFTNDLTVLYIVSFAIASLGSFFNPSIDSSVPQIVGQEKLGKANSLLNGGRTLAMIIGPALAAVCVKYFGISATFLLDTISFIIFGIAILFVRIPKLDTIKAESFRELHNDIFHGLKFVWANKNILSLLTSYSVAWCVMGALGTLELVFCVRVLMVDTSVYGQIVAVAGVGAVVGSFAYVLLEKKINTSIIYLLGICFFGLGISLFSLQTTLLLTIPFLLMEGIGESFFTISGRCYLQLFVPSDLLGRIMSHKNLVEKLGMISGMIISGILATYFNVGSILFVFGSSLLLISATLPICKGLGVVRS